MATSEIAVRDFNAPLTAANIREQVNLIQEVMREVMQGPSKENPDGVHYGIIPGCKKPSLLKPGAEKLFLTFRLRPIIDPVSDVVITELPNGHRDYRVHCHLLNMSGVEMATGIGSCSTMESKYRYRGGEKKPTNKPVPKDYWNLHKAGKIKEALDLIGGPGFAPGKYEGEWVICEKGEKMENPDIADTYNTVLKMAEKRAKVDGCLSATACSDIFTQDVEEFSEPAPVAATNEPEKPKPSTPKPLPAATTGNKISGVIEKFLPCAAGKKSCNVIVGGNYYCAKTSQTDFVREMEMRVGQEVEITFEPQEYKDMVFNWITGLIPCVQAESVAPNPDEEARD